MKNSKNHQAFEEQTETLEKIAFDVSVENEFFIVPVIKTVEKYERKQDTILVREVQDTGEAYV